jgi:hypothetical protein
MAEFAQFVVPTPDSDRSFRLSPSVGNSRDFFFDLLNLDTTRTVIIFFKVGMSPDGHLFMDINDVGLPQIDLAMDPPQGLHALRSWHEIVNGLTASNNRLRVIAQEGEVILSDILFLYHAKTD